MLELIIKIKNVDYSSISNKVIPLFLEKQSHKVELGKTIKLLSKFKNLSATAASTALMILPQTVKDDVAVFIVKSYDEKIAQEVNSLMQKKNVNLTIKEISVVKEEMINLVLRFDEINYAELISTAYPQIVDRYKTNEKYSKMFTILDKLNGYSDKLIQATIETLSQDEVDELVNCIISTYEDEILKQINDFAKNNGMIIEFAGIELIKK